MSSPGIPAFEPYRKDGGSAIRRLLFVSDAAVADVGQLPPPVRAVIDEAAAVYVLTPTLPGRRAWLADDVDLVRHVADERLDTVLGHMHSIGAHASGVAARGSVLTVIADAVAEFGPDHILLALRSSEHANWQERGLVKHIQRAGLKAKPEVGIQFGAGGATTPAELEQEGTRDVGYAINLARRCPDAGAYMIMIESGGITEEVTTWRTDVVATIARELGLEIVMFEAADPGAFGWYVKNDGPEANLFIDHSQIVQLECLRRGIWGTKSRWGRVVAYPGA